MFTCIGKQKGERGSIVSCTNVSEVPSNPDRPDWGWLCPQCLGTQYGRAAFHADVIDTDPPNSDEMELDAYEGRIQYGPLAQSEQEEIDNLQELDIL